MEGDESALAIEEQKGEHADERRKHCRQGNQTTHDTAARKVVAREEEGERDPDCSSQHHRRERDPQTAPERLRLVPPLQELPHEVDGPPIRAAKTLHQDQHQRVHDQPQQEDQ